MDAPYYNAGPDERWSDDTYQRTREDVWVTCAATGCDRKVHLEHYDAGDPLPLCDVCYGVARRAIAEGR